MIYDFDGERYQVASAHQQEWGRRLIEELPLAGNERILDLGCGDGTVTRELAEALGGGTVVGMDASPGMIAAARRKVRSNLSFELLDINELAYIEAFDIIISNAALHWINDHRQLLARVRRALRDGGLVRFNFAGEGNCAAFIAVVIEVMNERRFVPHFNGFTWPWYMPAVSTYAALVEQSGLRESRVWFENADRYFPDHLTMTRWIEQPSLVPFLEWLPVADQSVFRDLVVERMIKLTRQHDGRCFETFRRIQVTARR